MFDALAGLAGNVFGSALSFLGAKKQNKAAMNMAREQMAFQERMSNTAYQRSTADMRAAGINPMVAYSQGGASAPPGTSAPIVNEAGGVDAGSAIQSALAVRRARAELDNLDADTAKKREDAILTRDLSDNERKKFIGLQIDNLNKVVSNNILNQQLSDAKSAASVTQKQNAIDAQYLETDFGKIMHSLGLPVGSAKAVTDLLKSGKAVIPKLK